MGLYAGEYHWAVCRAFDAVGDTTVRDDLLRRAVGSINDTARHPVPVPFRDSFLNRNPFNRQLRAMAARSRRVSGLFRGAKDRDPEQGA